MKWQISNIEVNGPGNWYIEGFRDDGRTLYTTIKRTTYQDAKVNKKKYLGNFPDYNEGVALSYINEYEVYIIDITMDCNREEVEKMKKNKYVSTKQLFFNGIPCMGLPLPVFAHWKGLIETDVD